MASQIIQKTIQQAEALVSELKQDALTDDFAAAKARVIAFIASTEHESFLLGDLDLFECGVAAMQRHGKWVTYDYGYPALSRSARRRLCVDYPALSWSARWRWRLGVIARQWLRRT
jgi:hypothetical protein